MTDDSAFEIGCNLATTPGSVDLRNPLIQLIQYAPLTEQVHKTAAADHCRPASTSSHHGSAAGQFAGALHGRAGLHGVPGVLANIKAEQAHFGWDDYLQKGPITALDVVRDVTKVEKPTCWASASAAPSSSSALAVLKGRGKTRSRASASHDHPARFCRRRRDRLPGRQASVAGREATIGKGRRVLGRELARCFSSLRANDLIWRYVVGNYLKGQNPEAFDLLYWNSDSTNIAGPFIAWYLRNMYLENNLRVPASSRCWASRSTSARSMCQPT